GGGGVNALDGGAGTDRAGFSLNPGNYYIAASGNNYVVKGPGGEDDTLSSIENVFFDGTGQTLSLAQFQSAAFDPWEYVASNKVLLDGNYASNINAAVDHYMLHGYAEHFAVDSFDPYEYVASNKVLLDANYANNIGAAIQHYVLHGYGEHFAV